MYTLKQIVTRGVYNRPWAVVNSRGVIVEIRENCYAIFATREDAAQFIVEYTAMEILRTTVQE